MLSQELENAIENEIKSREKLIIKEYLESEEFYCELDKQVKKEISSHNLYFATRATIGEGLKLALISPYNSKKIIKFSEIKMVGDELHEKFVAEELERYAENLRKKLNT